MMIWGGFSLVQRSREWHARNLAVQLEAWATKEYSSRRAGATEGHDSTAALDFSAFSFTAVSSPAAAAVVSMPVIPSPNTAAVYVSFA